MALVIKNTLVLACGHEVPDVLQSLSIFNGLKLMNVASTYVCPTHGNAQQVRGVRHEQVNQ